MEIITQLIRLQEIDNEIRKLKEKLKEKPSILESKKKEIEEKEKEILNLTTNMKELQKNIDRQNLDVKEEEEKIKELQAKLFTIKTNKEYSAAKKEIEARNSHLSELEDKILLDMEKLETLEERLNEQKRLLEEKRQEFKNIENSTLKEMEEIKKEIENFEHKRSEFVNKIEDKEAIQSYTRLLNLPDGQAIVPVIPSMKKNQNVDFICKGCFMQIPPQTLNELLQGDHLVYCKSCHRILYLKDHNEEATETR